MSELSTAQVANPADAQADVLLVVMPFQDPNLPAVGVSLLKSALESRGIRTRVLYLNMRFADLIGLDLYSHLCGSELLSRLAGEWVFSRQAFGAGVAGETEFADYMLSDWLQRISSRVDSDEADIAREQRHLENEVIPRVLSLADSCGAYLDSAVNEILAAAPAVVGFTLVMGQTAPSVAAAKFLKERAADCAVIFGGPGCFGPMGAQMIRSFPWIDYVCCGEGDLGFPEFAGRLLQDRDAVPPRGIRSRDGSVSDAKPDVVTDLDSVATPDYSDYFEQRAQASINSDLDTPSVLMETSRGCWWGERSQCRFCGLNGPHIGYRGKSPQRIAREMKHLVGRTGVRKIQLTDNILDTRQSEVLFRTLAWRCPGVEIHCETTANLNFEQLRQLRAGGVRHVQPGIESLSDPILRLMRKGTSFFQNVNILRSAEELGLRVSWFSIWGIPDEPPDEYERMADVVPLLAHLAPPVACRQITLQRFSPYFENWEEYGFRSVRPSDPYSLVFPLREEEMENLCSSFAYEYADGRDPLEYTRAFRKAVMDWQAGWDGGPERRPRLDALSIDRTLMVSDTRPCSIRSTHRLTDLAAEVLRLCRSPHTRGLMVEKLQGLGSQREIDSVVGDLIEWRLVVEYGGRLMSLVVHRGPKTGILHL